MAKLLAKVDGWKTEIGLAGMLVLFVLRKLEVLDRGTFEWALAGLLGWTGWAVKHAIKKSGPNSLTRIGRLMGGNGDGKRS